MMLAIHIPRNSIVNELFVNVFHNLTSPFSPGCYSLVETVPDAQATAFHPFGNAFLALWLTAVAVDAAL